MIICVSICIYLQIYVYMSNMYIVYKRLMHPGSYNESHTGWRVCWLGLRFVDTQYIYIYKGSQPLRVLLMGVGSVGCSGGWLAC